MTDTDSLLRECYALIEAMCSRFVTYDEVKILKAKIAHLSAPPVGWFHYMPPRRKESFSDDWVTRFSPDGLPLPPPKEPDPTPAGDALQGETMKGSDYYAPVQPCLGCGKPLLLENAWMEDGCPCNTPAGVNNHNLYRWNLLHQLQQKDSRELSAARRELSELKEDFDALEGLSNAATKRRQDAEQKLAEANKEIARLKQDYAGYCVTLMRMGVHRFGTLDEALEKIESRLAAYERAMPEEPDTIEITDHLYVRKPDYDALRQTCAGYRVDAERYRWMRDHATYAGADQHRLDWYLPRARGPLNEQLDAAIDAAIDAKGAKP